MSLAELQTQLKELEDFSAFKHFAQEYNPQALSHGCTTCFGTVDDGVIETIQHSKDGNRPILSGYYRRAQWSRSIVAISSMVGCPKRCSFCPLGSRPFVRILSSDELLEQVIFALAAGQRAFDVDDSAMKLTFAKAGEPLLNPNVLPAMQAVAHLVQTIKYSTVFPGGRKAANEFRRLASFASQSETPFQLQISLLSTADPQRQEIAGGKVENLKQIGQWLTFWHHKAMGPCFRKPNLSITFHRNCAMATEDLEQHITPELANIRFRPYVPTDTGLLNGLLERELEQSEELREKLERIGFKVSLAGQPSQVEQQFGISSVSEISVYENRIA